MGGSRKGGAVCPAALERSTRNCARCTAQRREVGPARFPGPWLVAGDGHGVIGRPGRGQMHALPTVRRWHPPVDPACTPIRSRAETLEAAPFLGWTAAVILFEPFPDRSHLALAPEPLPRGFDRGGNGHPQLRHCYPHPRMSTRG